MILFLHQMDMLKIVTLMIKLYYEVLIVGYRTTPHTTTEETPAELFLKRPIRTRLDLLKPNLEDKVIQKQEDQKRFHDNSATKTREFLPGQDVLVENLRNTTPKWITGKIIAKTGPLSYKVEIDGVIHRRHVDQLLSSKAQVVIPNEPTEDVFVPTPVECTTPEAASEQITRHHPPRNRRPPDRLTY